jgi:tetratricopeptide (TPR) repeat protein
MRRKRQRSRTPFGSDLAEFYHGECGQRLFEPLMSPPDDPDFELAFCREILGRGPDNVEALALLGEIYARRGQYDKGLEADLRLSQLRPASAAVRYNLACSYARLGLKEEALAALREAAAAGYSNLEHLRQDHDLDNVRSDPRFRSLVEQLLAGKEARQPA